MENAPESELSVTAKVNTPSDADGRHVRRASQCNQAISAICSHFACTDITEEDIAEETDDRPSHQYYLVAVLRYLNPKGTQSVPGKRLVKLLIAESKARECASSIARWK